MASDLSDNDRRALLTTALRTTSTTEDVFITDRSADRVIYQDARSRRCYERTYSVDANTNAVRLGPAQEVRQLTSYATVAPASFRLDAAAEPQGAVVLRSGKIFEIGTYADKAFSLDAAEAQAAIAAFQPVPIDLEHRSTPLDGKLGQLTDVRLDDDGQTITGTVAIPQWLDTALGDAGRKVSLTWDRATKTIRGLALTNTPRVADAALFAAFTAATGEPIPTPSTVTEEPAPMETKKTGVAAFFARLLGKEEQEVAEAIAATLQPAAFSQADRDEIAQLRAAIARRDAERIQADAAAFADAQIAIGKALPAERDAIVAAFAQAAQDDQAHGLVAFTAEDGSAGSRPRLDAIRALFSERPAHVLTTELVKDAAGVVFATTATPDPHAPTQPGPARIAELASKTPLGRAAIQS